MSFNLGTPVIISQNILGEVLPVGYHGVITEVFSDSGYEIDSSYLYLEEEFTLDLQIGDIVRTRTTDGDWDNREGTIVSIDTKEYVFEVNIGKQNLPFDYDELEFISRPPEGDEDKLDNAVPKDGHMPLYILDDGTPVYGDHKSLADCKVIPGVCYPGFPSIPKPQHTNAIPVKIKRLSPNAVVPSYATLHSACFDLVCAEDIIVQPGETVMVNTGLAFEIPEGYQMKILPRSGISVKTPLQVILGTVDSDYRGEVKVILRNTTERTEFKSTVVINISGDSEIPSSVVPENTYVIHKGDRIAQAEVLPVLQAEFTVVDELSETERGTGGFGSSGVKS